MIRIYLISLLALFLIFPHILDAQVWNFQQKLGTLDQEAADNLGFSTAISDSFMVTGAWWEEGELDGNGPVNESGAAYIFKLQPDGSWQEVQKLVSPNRERLGYFGYSVAIADSFLLVSAINEDRGSLGNPGAVYVYRRISAETWELEDRLIASDAENGDVLGWSVALTDGYALLGAPNHKLDENGGNSLDKAGAAYLFERQANQTWQQIKKFVAFDRIEDMSFGKYLDIDETGLIIGAFDADHGTSPLRAGYAYAAYDESLIFSNLTSSDLQKITASDATSLQFFGWDVSISDKWAVVGASGERNPPPGGQGSAEGVAYFFYYENNMWVEKQKVWPSDHENSGQFGRAIDILGNACIIGAGMTDSDENNANIVFRSGAAHIFELQSDNTWAEVQKLAGTGRSVDDLYGEAVAINETHAVVGAWRADSIDSAYLIDGGAVYTYERTWPVGLGSQQILEDIHFISGIPKEGLIKIRNTRNQELPHIIQIFTANGQLVYEEKLPSLRNWQKEFLELSSGLYVVKVSRENRSKSWKWVKF